MASNKLYNPHTSEYPLKPLCQWVSHKTFVPSGYPIKLFCQSVKSHEVLLVEQGSGWPRRRMKLNVSQWVLKSLTVPVKPSRHKEFVLSVIDSYCALDSQVILQQYVKRKPLEDVTVFEKANAIFECEVSHKNHPVTWYINEVEVVPSMKHQILCEDFTHKLAIEMTKLEDSGEIKVDFHGITSQARLEVAM